VQFAGVEVEIDPPVVFGEPGQPKELFSLVGGKNLQTMGTVSVGEHLVKIATGDRRKSAARGRHNCCKFNALRKNEHFWAMGKNSQFGTGQPFLREQNGKQLARCVTNHRIVRRSQADCVTVLLSLRGTRC
jgi:hypothetical protein